MTNLRGGDVIRCDRCGRKQDYDRVLKEGGWTRRVFLFGGVAPIANTEEHYCPDCAKYLEAFK